MRRFGHVEFDPVRRSLRVGGRPVALDRSSMAILALLLDAGGEDVDKDRLLEAGWPGRVVHENSLAKAIGRLRQAMREDGRLLETVHGYGYRLAVEPEAGPTAAAAGGTAPRARRLRRPLLAGAIAAASLAIAAAVLVWPAKRPLIRGEAADIRGRILWVDDHPENNAEEKRYLERRKIAVYQVRSSEEALALLAMYDYRAVISDMNRSDKPLEGLALVREMRRRKDMTPFYLYTYVPSAAQRAILAQAGGQGAAVKSDELYAALLPLFEKGRQAAH